MNRAVRCPADRVTNVHIELRDDFDAVGLRGSRTLLTSLQSGAYASPLEGALRQNLAS